MFSRLDNIHRYWKFLSLFAVLFIALVSSAFAYWRFTTSSTPVLYVTASYPPLELRMQLDKANFAQSERIAIHFSLRNLDNKETNVTFTDLGHYFEFRVLDKKNKEVYTTLYWGGFPAEDLVTLSPHGELIKNDYYFSYWDQTSTVEGEFYRKQVPIGTYRIFGSTGYICKIGDGEYITPAITIEAPPISITIS